MKKVAIKRSTLLMEPDRKRVLVRPFHVAGEQRRSMLLERVLALSEVEVHSLLAGLRAEFADRQPNLDEFLLRRYHEVCAPLLDRLKISAERQLLLGGCFTHEYSLEAAALFNPSIVSHPDQSNVPDGSLRFILSLRATAEGHISSIVFRSGVLHAGGEVTMDSLSPYTIEPIQAPNASFEKGLFERKLQELRLMGDFNRRVLDGLADCFTLEELFSGVKRTREGSSAEERESNKAVMDQTLVLARSNYEVRFSPASELSERVLFPVTPEQSNGIEDARFVDFREDDGARTYYATYTAYDGRAIMPQFLETADFEHFKFITLNGPAVGNKGMALFPRRVNGRYAMLGRQDGVSISIMFSDQLHFWNEGQVLLEPKFPWELIQLGNCGSPIETDAGWLVLSHGVGPMRKYCIGAFLLDLEDPTKVIGRLSEPLMQPNAQERDGYVPNVLYSCGSILHGRRLVIPYGTSDYATTFATVPLDDVLAAME